MSWFAIRFESTYPSLMIATEVSSHEDSIANIVTDISKIFKMQISQKNRGKNRLIKKYFDARDLYNSIRKNSLKKYPFFVFSLIDLGYFNVFLFISFYLAILVNTFVGH